MTFDITSIRFLYDLLISSCDADEAMFQQFSNHLLDHSSAVLPLRRRCDSHIEFRFQGCFGFGGKFYIQGDKMWVAGYKEDMTPERKKRCKIVNEFLKLISSAWTKE